MAAYSRPSASIVLFGALSRFTAFTLERLLHRGANIRTAVLHAFPPASALPARSALQVAAPLLPPVVDLCRRHDVPVEFFTGDERSLLRTLACVEADYFVLSCFPKRMSQALIQRARRDCINIHPSRLPKYRGINPLFWQLKMAEPETGFTLHRVTRALDSGPIIVSDRVAFGIGGRLRDIQRTVADAAVKALQKALAEPLESFPGVPQDHTQASWQAAPEDKDYTLRCGAVRAMAAFNFVRAYSGTGAPLAALCDAGRHRVHDAIEYRNTSRWPPKSSDPRQIWFRCQDGFVKLLIVNAHGIH